MSGGDPALMRRAIALAERHLGLTGDNPAVGCVIVRDGLIIGEAVTAEGGRPHAEEQALTLAGSAAAGADVYVTLEPCGERSSGVASCATLLAAAKVARVFIACSDPSVFAAGQGTMRLRDAGVDVQLGLLANEAALLYGAYRPAGRR